VLLGSTKRSNIQDREIEEKEIVAQLTILRSLGNHYTSLRPQAQTLSNRILILILIHTRTYIHHLFALSLSFVHTHTLYSLYGCIHDKRKCT
jgi:hypothetical protein